MTPTPDDIRNLRSRHSLSQARLAEAALCSKRYVEDCEQGISKMHAAIWAYVNARLEQTAPDPYLPSPKACRKPRQSRQTVR